MVKYEGFITFRQTIKHEHEKDANFERVDGQRKTAANTHMIQGKRNKIPPYVASREDPAKMNQPFYIQTIQRNNLFSRPCLPFHGRKEE